MARYIDADRLSKQILDSWDNNNHRTIQASQVHSQEHQHLMRMIEKQPTADVVPKSEVEELQTENEELQAKVAKLRKENVELLVSKETDIHISMEKLVKVRTEHPIFKAIEEKVAREIFDDIANIMVLQHGFNEKRIVAHIDFELLKELKKKYTENME